METFDASWLALREPWDARARSRRLAMAVDAAVGRPDATVGVLDLGSGTGANLRYLADHLGPSQDWLLTDHDAALIARLPALLASWARSRAATIDSTEGTITILEAQRSLRVTSRVVDLIGIDLDRLVGGRRLVTASALLDLVSRDWLRQVIEACVRHRAAVLFALTYDGRISCDPADPADADIRDLVNRHQQVDKGFGPALGPAAVDAFAEVLRRQDYVLVREPSDWVLTADAAEMQRCLVTGWAQAATALSPDRASSIVEWRTRRLALIDRGCSRIRVGHVDVAAWPDPSRTRA